jgi:TonB family protein
MKRVIALLPLLLLCAATASAGNDLVLDINVFQGFRTTAPAGEPSSSPVVLLPPDPGWSSEIEKQRQQIVENLGLDGVTIVGKMRLLSAFGSSQSVEFPREGAPPLIVELKPVHSGGSRVGLDIRLAERNSPESILASFSVSGELGKTFIVGGKASAGPLLVSVTPKEPAAVGVTGDENGPRKIGPDVKPPRLINRIEPKYPEALRAEGKSGLVVLQTTIDRQGAVVNPVVVRHAEPELDAAAIEAVRQWRYEPATAEGKPVAVYFTITVSFRLK